MCKAPAVGGSHATAADADKAEAAVKGATTMNKVSSASKQLACLHACYLTCHTGTPGCSRCPLMKSQQGTRRLTRRLRLGTDANFYGN